MPQLIEEYVGVSGFTTDWEFANLVEVLREKANVLDEIDEISFLADSVTTVYRDKLTGQLYELWYQVRNPDSPEGRDYAFAFSRKVIHSSTF